MRKVGGLLLLLLLSGCGPTLRDQIRVATANYDTHLAVVNGRYFTFRARLADHQKEAEGFRYALSDDQAAKLNRYLQLKNKTSWDDFTASLTEQQKGDLRDLSVTWEMLDRDRHQLIQEVDLLRAEAEHMATLEAEYQRRLAIATALLGYMQQQQYLDQQRAYQQQLINQLNSINSQLQGIRSGW